MLILLTNVDFCDKVKLYILRCYLKSIVIKIRNITLINFLKNKDNKEKQGYYFPFNCLVIRHKKIRFLDHPFDHPIH